MVQDHKSQHEKVLAHCHLQVTDTMKNVRGKRSFWGGGGGPLNFGKVYACNKILLKSLQCFNSHPHDQGVMQSPTWLAKLHWAYLSNLDQLYTLLQKQ